MAFCVDAVVASVLGRLVYCAESKNKELLRQIRHGGYARTVDLSLLARMLPGKFWEKGLHQWQWLLFSPP